MFAVALAAGAAAFAGGTRPSDGALRKAFERNRASVVEVSSPRGRGTGVVVSEGVVATAVSHVGLEEARVRIGDDVRGGRVTHANARLKVALVEFDGQTPSPAAIAPRVELVRGMWLVGIEAPRSARAAQPKPHAGRIVRGTRLDDPFIVTDLPLRPGSPIFDAKGRLVAIAVERVGRIGSRALPISVLKAQLAQAPSP